MCAQRNRPAAELGIELLMLANHAEAINGLLYLSGGAWTDHYRAVAPGVPVPQSHLAIAVSILVPWNETNVPHRLTVRVENEDVTSSLAQIDAQLNVGRGPTMQQGAVQHAVFAVPVTVMFPGPGGYRLVADLDGGIDMRVWSFRVHDVPATVAPPPPPVGHSTA